MQITKCHVWDIETGNETNMNRQTHGELIQLCHPKTSRTARSPIGPNSRSPVSPSLWSIRNLSPQLWAMTHLTSLYLNDNSLSRIPQDIARLTSLMHLDLSCNKLRSLPAELGDLIMLRELLLNNNYLRCLPYELGKLFQIQTLGLKGNPLTQELLVIYNEPNGTQRLLSYLLDNLVVGKATVETGTVFSYTGQTGSQRISASFCLVT
ncbi:unnamed protein product [Medioppia subpectinata]|uniref:CCR4-NOT transcription complex subunit 6-like n=1 Tax=Medioppia subpectinata TaxID=1979941 RepID=A0A7R9PZR2_9ACAR|nr:unnamed protein product [Medioppia subpectinata]CAG2107351.1 unnamed protein product [Medioppia subpectinata]